MEPLQAPRSGGPAYPQTKTLYNFLEASFSPTTSQNGPGTVPKASPVAASSLPSLTPPIAREEILVISKLSKFDREKSSRNLTDSQAMEHFGAIGESGLRILAAHLHHSESIERCKHELPPANVMTLDQFDAIPDLSRFKLVIALGGDDFFKLVGHHVKDSLPVLGVNSDATSSVGALLPITIDKLPAALTMIERGHYRLAHWTRLSLTLNGIAHGSAISEIVLGKLNVLLTSRHELEYKGEKVVQRCSGILISSGVGSTGWYSSAGLYLGTADRSFPKTARVAKFELREPSVTLSFNADGSRAVELPKFVEGIIEEGEILRITSLNDEGGVASRDSIDQIPFPRGSVAQVSLDPKPLVVLIPEGASC